MLRAYVFLCCLLALAATQAQGYSFTSQEVKCHGKPTRISIHLLEY